ncbi:Bug family tripartite tricarboxylate transporter substrate binding protein [Falsiroseomonas oryzae]|uniref:Bug family tripartite tricarboxylate transporter substrate binding protein n=1 Tax=Falsiroseomonas oryzae TaxID=2766473 RepID=UPI0022EAED5B|nr:tripartite tricarboxylate transporter substrate binding protein [Roseomonas sp. MO-31]
MTDERSPFAAGRRAALGGVLAALAAPSLARAQAAWPTRPVQVIVPYAPGGTGDIFARLIAERLRPALGQNVLVENRSGASGTLGTQIVARATADGHTLLFGQTPEIAIAPRFLPNAGYNPAIDLMPIALVANASLGLVVNAASPYRSVADLLEEARRQPGRLTFASSGTGTPGHFAAEVLSLQGGRMVHAPYRGAGPALTDLLGRHVDFFFSGLPAAIPHVRDGRLRLVAVSTARRIPAAPDTPTVQEGGVAGFDFSLWGGLFAPAVTPDAVVRRLNEETNRIIADPQIRDRLIQDGGDVVAMSPQEFRAFAEREMAKYARVIEATGVRPE